MKCTWIAAVVCLFTGFSFPARAADNVVINEFMAVNGDGLKDSFGDPSDWIELRNAGTNNVNLDGWYLTDATNNLMKWRFPQTNIAAGAYLVVFASDHDLRVAGAELHTNFRLSSDGEYLALVRPDLSIASEYADKYPLQVEDISYGLGATSSQVVLLGPGAPVKAFIPPNNGLEGPAGQVRPWTAPLFNDSAWASGTTGVGYGASYVALNGLNVAAMSNVIETVYIRIPFTVTDPTAFEALTLRMRYDDGFIAYLNGREIAWDNSPDPSVATWNSGAPANRPNTDAVIPRDFNVTSLMGFLQVGTFGRYITSDGDIDFVAMKNRSFGHDNPPDVFDFRMGTGLPNPGPLVGPVVINEVMYHPPDIMVGTNSVDDSDNEYIELKNIMPTPVNLFDPAAATNTWRLRDAVSFDLPMNTTLPAGGVLVIVHFNPATNATLLAAFRTRYGLSNTIPIYGPYKGKLSNKGDTIELLKPDPPQTTGLIGFVPYILVERVNFNDKIPWPETPDGDGVALVRLIPEGYGNDPINWTAGMPTPGREVVRGLTISLANGVTHIRFLGVAGNTYTVQYRGSLASGSWNELVDVAAVPATQMREVTDPVGGGGRFYRVVTPAQ